MANPLKALLNLLPGDPTLRGVVTGVDVHQTSVTLLDGSVIKCRGAGEIGDAVFVKGHLIEGTAPLLTQIEIEV